MDERDVRDDCGAERLIAAILGAWRFWERQKTNPRRAKADPRLWRDLARNRARYAAYLRERERLWRIVCD